MTQTNLPTHHIKKKSFLDRVSLKLKIYRHLKNFWPFSHSNPWEIAFVKSDLTLSNLLHEANIKVGDISNSLVIHSILRNFRQNIDKVLLNALDMGLNPNIIHSNSYLNTILHKYSAGNNEEVVKKLIECGADLEVRCGNKYTPLCVALTGFGADAGIFKEQDDIINMIDILLSAKASAKALQGRKNDSILEYAPMQLKVWKKLIDAGASPISKHTTDTHVNVNNNNSKVPESINSFRRLNDVPACEINNWIDFFFECGMNKNTKINKGNNLFFHWLLIKRSAEFEDISKALNDFIEKGFDFIDENKNTVFHQVLKSENIPNINHFLNYFLAHPKTKHLVSQKNKDNLTPLDILSTRQDLTNDLLLYGTHPRFFGVVVKDMPIGKAKTIAFDLYKANIEKQILQISINQNKKPANQSKARKI